MRYEKIHKVKMIQTKAPHGKILVFFYKRKINNKMFVEKIKKETRPIKVFHGLK